MLVQLIVTPELRQVIQKTTESKEITYNGVRFKLIPRITCRDCLTPLVSRTGAPMIRQELWDLVVPENGHLCFCCLERRLGRELLLDDLLFCGLTLEWIWLNRLGLMDDPGFKDWVRRGKF